MVSASERDDRGIDFYCRDVRYAMAHSGGSIITASRTNDQILPRVVVLSQAVKLGRILTSRRAGLTEIDNVLEKGIILRSPRS